MIYIGLIIAVIILAIKNSEYRKELLKRKNERNINFCPHCGYNINNIAYKKIENKPVMMQNNLVQNNNVSIQKHTDKEIKNSLILIIGSVLIVLSAILFLTTTWNITHNVFKTMIIVLMLFLFFGASYIADNVLRLKQTAKAFYFIGLAFIPISLTSISLFSLLGKYLSIYGSGKYIYLTISSIITTFIYYFNAKYKNNKIIGIGSMIFSIVSIILFGLVFTTNQTVIMLLLSSYLALLCILYIYDKIYLDKELHLKSIITLVFSLLIITIYLSLNSIFSPNVFIKDILLDIIMFLNISIYYKKINKNENIYQFIYPILFILIFGHLTELFSIIFIKQIVIFSSFLLLYIYDLLKYSSIKKTTYLTIIISSVVLYLLTIYNTTNLDFYIPTYLILSLIGVLSLIHHFYKDENVSYPIYFLNIIIQLGCLDFILTKNYDITYVGYTSLVMILITLFFKFNESIKKSLLLIGNIFFVIISLFNYHNSIYLIILYVLYSFINILLYYKEQKNIYKIVSYISSNVFLFTLVNYIGINDYNIILLILPFTTVIFVFLEYIFKSLCKTEKNYYIWIQFLLSIILLNIIKSSIFNFVILLFIIVLYVIYMNKYKWNSNYLYIAYLGIIPYLYFKDIFNGFNYMYILSLGMLALLCYFIYNKKHNSYIVLFTLFILLHLGSFNESKYISLLLVSIGTFISYLVKEKNNIFKGLLYTYLLILIKFIIKDLGWTNLSIFNYGPYLIWWPFITRDIIKKYDINTYKIFEYLGYILINVYSLGNYTSEFDGLIFVFLLTLIVIVSYILKLGPVFLVSLLAILINVLLLTRTFWLSIPWWIYILIVGIILIIFAIYNELSIKKDSTSLIKKLKDRLNI